MSERIELDTFLSAYLSEAEEHLAAATEKALAIEGALKGGASNGRAVRDLYRILHTVKGLSAMVGVEPIVAIAHRLESILRAADRGVAALTLPALELIFEALRAIEHRLRALEQGKAVLAMPPSLLARLDAHDVRGAPATPGSAREVVFDLDPSIDAKLAGFERDQLLKGHAEGRRALRAEFVPSPRKAAEGLTINSVRDRVGSLAEIVKVVPVAVASTEMAPGGLSFLFLLLTSAEDLEIAAAAGCDLGAVRSLIAGTMGPLAVPDADDADQTGADGAALDPAGEIETPELHARSVLRVDVVRVDDAMDRLSALIVTRSRLARAVGALEGHSVAIRELQTIVQENARQLRDLRGALLRIRMVPFSEVLSRLPLILRGIRRTSGKEVRLETRAADAELDKAVAERIFPALVHLVRNAVDHGIGPREERLRQGKKAEGTVSIICSARSNRYLAIEVVDDGRGVDREALARSMGSEVPAGDVGLLEAMCRPGLSTRTEATTTSGRGMGMDIVRKIVVEQLGGDLSVHSRPGEGTTFTLQIPLTVSILDAFTVQCGQQRFTVPVAIVEEIVELDHRKVIRGPGRKGEERTALIERRGETIPLVDLARVLGLNRDSPEGPRQALVVRRGVEPVAFALDRVITQQETVVRPLVDPLVQAPGIAGSTDLGDGQPTLVLDLVAMVVALGRPRGTERVYAA